MMYLFFTLVIHQMKKEVDNYPFYCKYFNVFYSAAGITETIVLFNLPFLNSTIPPAKAKRVKSLPTPTFFPG